MQGVNRRKNGLDILKVSEDLVGWLVVWMLIFVGIRVVQYDVAEIC